MLYPITFPPYKVYNAKICDKLLSHANTCGKTIVGTKNKNK